MQIHVDKSRKSKYNKTGENMRKYDYILFDLDGTLIESAKGVELSLAHALEALQLPCPDLSDYTKYVGPPLEDTLRGMCAVPEELIPAAMQEYRDYYDAVAVKINQLFDGIPQLLDALHGAGCRLAICTSKNEPVAEFVARALGIDSLVDAICGSTLDGSRKAKVDLLPYALQTLGCENKTKAVMIGDTRFDAEGALLCGVDFLGATYGYGTVEGMAACGAIGFADSPQELLRFLK